MSVTARSRVVPLTAGALALSYPLAVLGGPSALGALALLAALSGCALALLRRPSAPLRRGMLALAGWLAVGFVGASFLRTRPLAGFGWVVLVLFLLPLPVVPWLYARTFADREGGR